MNDESFVTDILYMARRESENFNQSNPRQESTRRPSGERAAKNPLDPAIKICCLGYFCIRRADNAPIIIRPNTRPGALLQLLIVAGPQGIDKRRAESTLWAESQGLLDSTIYRLRKLLESESACQCESGFIMLNSAQVSVDAWLFDSEADGLLSRLRRRSAEQDAGEIAVRCERLLELYRGHFFALEASTLWIAKTRDRLQAKLMAAIQEAGNFWQMTARWDRAALLYQQLLERDNLAEEFHRELIRCHLARREYAEAINAFIRCRDALTSVPGIEPSSETDALYRQACHDEKKP